PTHALPCRRCPVMPPAHSSTLLPYTTLFRSPTRKSVVVFSPHPDDDVISMGGLLRKLWENENATVVAYMTSGNIAVFDHDVRRHLDFVERAATTLGLDRTAAQRVRGDVEASFERKAPGDVDLPAVQD